jgi:hypothetical protein
LSSLKAHHASCPIKLLKFRTENTMGEKQARIRDLLEQDYNNNTLTILANTAYDSPGILSRFDVHNIRINGLVLTYDFGKDGPTAGGFSGAPIFINVGYGQPRMIGIHTAGLSSSAMGRIVCFDAKGSTLPVPSLKRRKN